jgi:hypothetical protein
MRRLWTALPVAAVIALAGCGGNSAKSRSRTTVSTTQTALAAVGAASATKPAGAPTTGTTGTGTAGAKAPVPGTGTTTSAPTSSSSSTSTMRSATRTAPAEKPQAVAPKQKSPVPCLVQAGLLRPGRGAEFGTWQGTDPASHRPIYVDGPYKSVADANTSAGTLQGVEQVQGGGLWVVSASLRGGTGPAVQRVAKCLRR